MLRPPCVLRASDVRPETRRQRLQTHGREGGCFDADFSAPLDQSGLHGRNDVLGTAASQDDSRQVRLHHPLHTKLLGNSIQFIQLESLAAPRLRQRFERDVEADLVPESKTGRNRACETVDANGLPLDEVHPRCQSRTRPRRC
jgi:hypothetical protein